MASLSLRACLEAAVYRSGWGSRVFPLLPSRLFPTEFARGPEPRLVGRALVWSSHGCACAGIEVPWDLESVTDTDRTKLLIFSAVGLVVQSPQGREQMATPPGDPLVPMSSTLPPLLVSRCSGALHVGQYCDSISRMNS